MKFFRPNRENFPGGSGKIISAIWECRTSVLVQSTPRAIRCQQPLLRVPIQRQHGAPGQPLHGEVWWLAAVRDRVDDRRGKKRESEDASHPAIRGYVPEPAEARVRIHLVPHLSPRIPRLIGENSWEAAHVRAIYGCPRTQRTAAECIEAEAQEALDKGD